MNTIASFASAAMVIVLALSQPGLAAAKNVDNPTCKLAASPQSGPLPLKVHFQVISSLNSDTMIVFGDTQPSFVGTETDHVYDGKTGKFTAQAIINNGLQPITCPAEITVEATSVPNTTNNGPTKPEATPAAPVTSTDNETSNASVSTNSGSNNPVISGNNNTVSINIEQPQATEPAPVINITNVMPTPVPVTTPVAPTPTNRNGWDFLYELMVRVFGH